MPEMWAHCGPCSRWFYVPFSTGEAMSRSACPVCSEQPDGFEVRLAEKAFPVEMTEDAAIR